MVVSLERGLLKLTEREQLVILEIGLDSIDSASSFVGYISETYSISKSSVWYLLNRLKEKKLLDFANKDEHGKPLKLTETGAEVLDHIDSNSKELMARYESIPLVYNTKSESFGAYRF
jgi:DNA-binding PadR family transcriptional regulator